MAIPVLLTKFLRLVTTQVKVLTARAAAISLTSLDSETRAEALERLSERMQETVQTPLGPIRFYALTPLLVARAKGMLAKETDTICWIDAFPNGTVFWDIGANVGIYSLYAWRRGGVRVVAFEPGAANYHVLCRNLQLNGAAATAYCLAFARESRLGVLNLSSDEMGSAIHQFGDAGEMSRYYDGADGLEQGTIGFSVDDFVMRFTPPFPQFIKLDVDGLEWAILQGAKKTLRDSRLRSLMVELTLSDKEEHDLAVALLEDSGFRFVSRGNTQGTGVEEAANHLFERRSES